MLSLHQLPPKGLRSPERKDSYTVSRKSISENIRLNRSQIRDICPVYQAELPIMLWAEQRLISNRVALICFALFSIAKGHEI